MKTGLRFAAVSAICLVPFTYPLSAMAWDALSVQEAYQRCADGDPRGCAVLQQYQLQMYQQKAPVQPRSPADRWVSPQEHVRHGSLSTWDLIDRTLIPVRAFLRSGDIPPPEYGAYGIMALRAKPTSVTRQRLKMACAAFIAYLARQIDVPKSVPLSDQMLSIWPLDSPDGGSQKG